MNKLESIAKRIAEIHDEIKSLKSQREANLQHCHGNPTSVSIKISLMVIMPITHLLLIPACSMRTRLQKKIMKQKWMMVGITGMARLSII